MLKNYFYAFLNAILDEFNQHYGFRAAALSFYTFISLIPLMIVIATLLSMLPFETPQITKSLYAILPEIPFNIQKGLSNISSMLVRQRNIYAFVSFFFAYYFASNLFISMHRILSSMFENTEISKTARIFQLLSIPIFILFLFLLYFGSMLITISLKSLIHLSKTSVFIPKLPDLLISLALNITNIISFFIFMLLLILMYHFLSKRSNRKLTHTLIIGGIVSLILTLIKMFFGTFITIIGNLNPIYGAFGGVFSFLAWIFMSYIIILIGARTIFYLEK